MSLFFSDAKKRRSEVICNSKNNSASLPLCVKVFCFFIFSPALCFSQEIEGVLEWGNTNVLSFSVTGTVKNINVQPGEKIKTDQLLAHLAKKPFDIKIQNKETKDINV